jgi:hypothetical protein
VRKALQFARRGYGYSARQLDRLCALLRKHRPVFGVSHVGILVTAPWPQRAELQQLCAAKNWSKAELEDEIKKRLGARRRGGRRRHVGADQGLLLVQLAELTDTFQRWQAAAARDSGAALDALPEQVRGLLDKAADSLQALREAVDEALRALREGAQRPQEA